MFFLDHEKKEQLFIIIGVIAFLGAVVLEFGSSYLH